MDYEPIVADLAARAGFSTATPAELVTLVVDWLEAEDDCPFGETWAEGLLQWGFVWNSGELRPDAAAMTRTLVGLINNLTARRLAWVLADLDTDAFFLRAFVDGPATGAQRDRAVQVRNELGGAVSRAISALADPDPRSRAYATSLLSNLGHVGIEVDAREPLAMVLEREREPVVKATLLLALRTPTALRGLGDHEADIVEQLRASGGPSPLWGGRAQVPTILDNAMAKVQMVEKPGPPRSA